MYVSLKCKHDLVYVYYCEMICCLVTKSYIWLFVTPWPVACQTPLSMGFPRQEYWSGLPFPAPGDLPDPEVEPLSPSLAGGFFTAEPPGKPLWNDYHIKIS